MKKVRFMGVALFVVLMSVALLLPISALAATSHAATPQAPSAKTHSLTVPVSGTTSGTVPGTFNGALTITKFVSQNGQLFAVGTLTGTVTNALGQVVQTVTQAVTVPITSASATCQILLLQTGAIHLNLLGLVVDISPITINITAQQGAGNLLGNLLCAITNLLNGGAPLTSLTNLLNNVLRAL